MTCCGSIQDITAMDDRSPVFMCGRCGKQGGASEFPDPLPPTPDPMTRAERVRQGIADALVSIAARISPNKF